MNSEEEMNQLRLPLNFPDQESLNKAVLELKEREDTLTQMVVSLGLNEEKARSIIDELSKKPEYHKVCVYGIPRIMYCSKEKGQSS